MIFRYHVLSYTTAELSNRLIEIWLEKKETHDPQKMQDLLLEKKAITQELQYRLNRVLEAPIF